MTDLANEIDKSFGVFQASIESSLNAAQALSQGQEALFKTSYRRLTSLQAWRSELLEASINERALSFFVEAQNDGVMSNVHAFDGRYRQSLQCLRSLIENVYRTLYYKDHPVELELWQESKHRVGRTELEVYLKSLPTVGAAAIMAEGVATLSKQYQTLNRAVHASAEGFRMSKDGKLKLSEFSLPDLRRWSSNERDIVTGINLVLLAVYQGYLQGAALPNLRKTIALILTSSDRQKVKKSVNVRLPSS